MPGADADLDVVTERAQAILELVWPMSLSFPRVSAGSSVLDELGLDPTHVVKAKLAIRIQRSIAEMGPTQREAAARMPISQPKLSLE